MPLDSEDKFDYETIYTVKKKSDASGESSPLGSGKKSQFAIGRTARQEESSAPKPKKKATPPSGGGTRKKAADAVLTVCCCFLAVLYFIAFILRWQVW